MRILETVSHKKVSRVVVVAALAAVYVAAARLGLSLAVLHPSATPVWPPTGIALAALLLLGRGAWPGIFLGAFAANWWVSGALAPSLGIAVGNTLEAVVGAWLVERYAGGRHAFESARGVFLFAGLAAVAATALSATLGVSSLCLGGLAGWDAFGPIWLTWWLGDASGALLVAPLLLVWSQASAEPADARRHWESVLLLAGTVLVGLVVFGGLTSAAARHMPLAFLCLPFLVAVAFRLNVRAAVTANALLGAVAIWGTLRGLGPFVRPDANESLLLLQAYMAVVALTITVLAAVVAERRRVTDALTVLESAVDNAAEAVVILAAGSTPARPRITFVNEGFRRMTGLAGADVLGGTLDALRVSPQEAMSSVRRAFAVGESFQREMVAWRKDGTEFALEMEIMPVPGRGGAGGYWVAILRDVSERRHHLAALEHQALHDALTGLPNRLLLNDRLEQSIRAAERDSASLAVLLIDLDRFKEVNDTVGHPAGDALLTQVGPRLRAVLRSVDTVARVGGDEFIVLLPAGGGPEDATRTAAKVLETLETPFDVEGHTFEISASIGIALYPEHGAAGPALLRAADVAMYVAKRSSDGFAIYSEGEDAQTRNRLVLLEELRQGIEKGELFLVYQPQAELATGRVSRVEALVRWRHPVRGLVLPDEFISGAERIGLSRRLTEWVLESALRRCARWRAAGLELPVAVNASIRVLRDGGIAARVRELLKELDLDPRLLTLEITESMMAEPLHALGSLEELRGTGVHLSIDDFGVGSLSLLALKQLPIDEIKIDKSFVLAMPDNEMDAAVVRSIIDLAHRLGCRVVAEGVETGAVWDRLRALGCDLAQGSYVSPGLPGEEVLQFLGDRRARSTARSSAL